MTSRIDDLMNRDVSELSAADIDEIMDYNRRLVAAYEKDVAEEKTAKRKAALKSGVVPISL
jgi:hypothetical protein